MVKSFWLKSRTNLPCLSVAINRTLTSSTRLWMVMMAPCGSSSELDTGGVNAAALGATDAYADDWAFDWAGARAATVSQTARHRKTRFVYFMPNRSNFFTLNPVRHYFLTI